MVDKIPTIPKAKIGARVGRLDEEDLPRLNQDVLVFLGLVVSPRVKRGGISGPLSIRRSRRYGGPDKKVPR